MVVLGEQWKEDSGRKNPQAKTQTPESTGPVKHTTFSRDTDRTLMACATHCLLRAKLIPFLAEVISHEVFVSLLLSAQ